MARAGSSLTFLHLRRINRAGCYLAIDEGVLPEPLSPQGGAQVAHALQSWDVPLPSVLLSYAPFPGAMLALQSGEVQAGREPQAADEACFGRERQSA